MSRRGRALLVQQAPWQSRRMVTTVSHTQLHDPVLRQLVAALTRRAFGWDTGDTIVDWAVAALLAGWNSPSLAILAGLSPRANEFEVDRHLADALSDLGVEVPDKAGMVRLYAVLIAEDIVSGATSPKDGCLELSKVCVEMDNSRSLVDFLGLDDALALAESRAWGTIDEVNQDIIASAKQLVNASR